MRKNVIKELKRLTPQCTDNAYFKDLIDIVVTLLENQPKTFSVIDRTTGKIADTYEIALHEDWAKGLCYCDMEGFALEEDGSLMLLDECGKFVYADPDRFEVVWDD